MIVHLSVLHHRIILDWNTSTQNNTTHAERNDRNEHRTWKCLHVVNFNWIQMMGSNFDVTTHENPRQLSFIFFNNFIHNFPAFHPFSISHRLRSKKNMSTPELLEEHRRLLFVAIVEDNLPDVAAWIASAQSSLSKNERLDLNFIVGTEGMYKKFSKDKSLRDLIGEHCKDDDHVKYADFSKSTPYRGIL